MIQDDNLEIHAIENMKGKKKLVKTNHMPRVFHKLGLFDIQR